MLVVVAATGVQFRPRSELAVTHGKNILTGSFSLLSCACNGQRVVHKQNVDFSLAKQCVDISKRQRKVGVQRPCDPTSQKGTTRVRVQQCATNRQVVVEVVAREMGHFNLSKATSLRLPVHGTILCRECDRSKLKQNTLGKTDKYSFSPFIPLTRSGNAPITSRISSASSACDRADFACKSKDKQTKTLQD